MLINKKAVKKMLLEHAASTRAHKYTRVATSTLVEINEAVRQICVNKVRVLPSKGKTI